MLGDIRDRTQKAKYFLEDLKKRGLIEDITNEEDLIEALVQDKKVYFGIDPTADFLHLGHYLSLTLIKRFLKEGYGVIIVLGGVTAQIGDPSFRSTERTFNFDPKLNSDHLKKILNSFFSKFCEEVGGSLEIKNNLDFLDSCLNSKCDYKRDVLIWYLKDICSKIKVSDLIHKEFIKERLKSGLTLSEFLYPTLQAFDFLYLYENHDVSIQIGGSDQWTNILAGKDLIEKKVTKITTIPVGLTFPILSDSSGKKLGKSDGNAIEILSKHNINPNLLSFRLYQYLINLDDSLILQYAKMLTFVELSEIEGWDEDIRLVKKLFAYEVCKDIYGSPWADDSRNVSANLFSEKFSSFTLMQALSVFSSYPKNILIPLDEEISLRDICIKGGLTDSNSSFGKLLKQNGIKVFSPNTIELSKDTTFTYRDSFQRFLPNNSSASLGFLVVKKGKKNFCMVVFANPEDFRNTPNLYLLSHSIKQ